MPDQLMAPPVPADADLHGMPWMKLNIDRLLESDLFALSSGDELKAALALWCKSWKQVPAGSLPADDRILASLSMAGSKWSRVREMALRGWCNHSDGRLYHPVVSEFVNDAWRERKEYLEHREADRLRKEKEAKERKRIVAALKKANITVAWNTPISKLREMCEKSGNLSAGNAKEIQKGSKKSPSPTLDKRERGRERGRGIQVVSGIDTTKRASSSSEVQNEMARALQSNGFPEFSPSHPDLQALAEEGHSAAEVLEAAIAGKGTKPITWITQRVRGRKADAAARATPAAPSAPARKPDPLGEAQREMEAKILQARNDGKLGLLQPDQVEQKVAEAKETFAAARSAATPEATACLA